MKYSGEKAKLSQASAGRVLERPGVQVEVRRLQLARIHNDLLPLAVNTLERIMLDAKASERGKIQAAKIVLDRAYNVASDAERKEAHEMTGDELQAALDRLRREAADRSRQVIEHDPAEASTIVEESPQASPFD
ncbi:MULTISPECIES: hypothetical protein [unclassified Aurantimonas]|uniref:hypothetical protein n=1 Tax=unclassified Aurantimonas TaxID=2638230 RepID=UPI002E1874F0|nr:MULTISPECIES: hypothetical protein [unclassified Aurantimonas]MEC5291574.1 hypothetical protein [Aurantimonas sp. C2-3-R2]MEC5412658.1 hypothetical protein [Aurantimonas sp. C2-4-R8]